MHQSKQIKNGCVVLNDYQANLANQYGGMDIITTRPKIGINPELNEYLGGGGDCAGKMPWFQNRAIVFLMLYKEFLYHDASSKNH